MNLAREQDISTVARIEEARSIIKNLIASISAEEPTTAKPAPTATQQTPTKSSSLAPRILRNAKGHKPLELFCIYFLLAYACLFCVVSCTCKDITPLKFEEVVLKCNAFVIACVCVVCCVKLCYLVFVYRLENLMKIN